MSPATTDQVPADSVPPVDAPRSECAYLRVNRLMGAFVASLAGASFPSGTSCFSIHPSAWNRNSRKFASMVLGSTLRPRGELYRRGIDKQLLRRSKAHFLADLSGFPPTTKII